MKYTILGFSQAKLVEFKLDAIDALILRYFVDFKDTGEMAMEIVEGKPFYWINYDSLLKQIPVINITSKNVLRRRFKKLQECNVLDHHHKKVGGSYSFYGIGSNYKELISSNTPTTKKSEGCYSKVLGDTTQKSNQNINLLNDNNIYSLVVDYLNKKANTKYRVESKKTKQIITFRINEGFKLEDFYKVIDNKALDWLGTDMQKYLRPETLFGNKFESYLNQKIECSNSGNKETTWGGKNFDEY